MRRASTARQPSGHSSNHLIIWLMPSPRWTSNWLYSPCARAIDATRRDVGAEDVDRPAAPFLRLFGKEHRERIDFLPGRAASGPDANSLRLGAALGELRQRIALEQVERRTIAEEIGFVVEQGFDDHLRQARLLAHDEDGDEFVDRPDRLARAASSKALSRSATGGSSSVAGRCAPRAGRRGFAWNCRLFALALLLRARGDPAGDLVGRKHSAGESGLEHGARHAPDRRSSLRPGR